MLFETVMIANRDALRHLIKASAYRSNRSCSQNTINAVVTCLNAISVQTPKYQNVSSNPIDIIKFVQISSSQLLDLRIHIN